MYEPVSLDQLALADSDELVGADTECEVEFDHVVVQCDCRTLDDDREAEVWLLVEIRVDLLGLVATAVGDEAVVLLEPCWKVVGETEVEDLVAVPIPVGVDPAARPVRRSRRKKQLKRGSDVAAVASRVCI